MTDPVTETRGLLERSTPGPWEWHDYAKSGRTLAHQPEPIGRVNGLDLHVHEMNVLKTTDDWPATAADEALIAASPRLLAALCDRIEELETAIDSGGGRSTIRKVAINVRQGDVTSATCSTVGAWMERVADARWALVDRDGTNTEQDPTTT